MIAQGERFPGGERTRGSSSYRNEKHPLTLGSTPQGSPGGWQVKSSVNLEWVRMVATSPSTFTASLACEIHPHLASFAYRRHWAVLVLQHQQTLKVYWQSNWKLSSTPVMFPLYMTWQGLVLPLGTLNRRYVAETNLKSPVMPKQVRENQ